MKMNFFLQLFWSVLSKQIYFFAGVLGFSSDPSGVIDSIYARASKEPVENCAQLTRHTETSVEHVDSPSVRMQA